jgi:alcohol dehydrogenase (cytochrome c)
MMCHRIAGVAVYGERVYVGTLDAHLVALPGQYRSGDLGRRGWAVPKTATAITSAPLVVKGKVVIGVAGGEFGIRGFIDAYDADSGRRAWRFYTVPSAGQPGSETWQGDSWRTGGGSTWLTGSFDPRLNLIYWGVGNPAPNFNGDARRATNLYTSSVVALDADTGILRWHFQFTPHDLHDWDSNQIPVLAI